MTRVSVETASRLAADLALEIEQERLGDMAAELSHLCNKMETFSLPATTEPSFRFTPLLQADAHDR